MATKICKLVLSSAVNNSNKIYIVDLEADGKVYGSYGRIGSKLVRTPRGVGQSTYDATVREKLRKGYTELQVVAPVTSLSSTGLEQLALTQIEYKDAHITELIKFFVAQNRHQIETSSGGGIKVDISGVVRTVTGDILTATAVRSAMVLLDKLYPLWAADPKSTAFYTMLGEYLTLIPQRVDRKGWDTLFVEASSFQTQHDFLDQLLGSAEMLSSTLSGVAPKTDEVKDPPRVFNTVIESVDSKDIAALFERTKCTIHHEVADYKVTSACRVHIKP